MGGIFQPMTADSLVFFDDDKTRVIDIAAKWMSDFFLIVTDDGLYKIEGKEGVPRPVRINLPLPMAAFWDQPTPGDVAASPEEVRQPIRRSSRNFRGSAESIASGGYRSKGRQWRGRSGQRNYNRLTAKTETYSALDSLQNSNDQVKTSRSKGKHPTKGEKKEDPLLDLSRFYNDEKFSDVIIEVGDVKIFANSFILKLTCPAFSRILNDITNRRTLNIYNRSAEVYSGFIKYLYTGTLSMGAFQLLELWQIARLYSVPRLASLIPEKFKETINQSNAAQLYDIVLQKKFKELESPIVEFVSQNREVFATDGFKTILPSTAQQLVAKVFARVSS